MKKMKKIMAVLLALVMCLSLAVPALAYNGTEFLEETKQSQEDANNAVTNSKDAQEKAEETKADAEEAKTATGEGSLVDETNKAEDQYQEALKNAEEKDADSKSAIDKVNEANEAIEEIETETNGKVDGLDETTKAALDKAQDAVEAATSEDGDVSKAVEAAKAAEDAAKAAEQIASSEDATTAEVRAAANAAKEAAGLANQAVETAQATLDAAQAEVTAAKEAYEQAQRDYAALIETANGEVKEIKDENQSAVDMIKAANEKLEAAKTALEVSEKKEADAKSAAETAQAAADKAAESAKAAQTALDAANASNISDKLGVEDITNMTEEQIDAAKADAEKAALEAFEKAYKESDNHVFDYFGDKAFERLEKVAVSTDELVALQEKLNRAWQDRETAKEEHAKAEQMWKDSLGHLDNGKWVTIAAEKSLEVTKKNNAYNAVYNEIASKLNLDIRDMTDTDRHPTILAIFQAKTDYEVAKENAAKYAEAAKAVVAAQEAKAAADAAKASADQALKDYQAAKAALEQAEALAGLQDAMFKVLADRQAALDEAQLKLTNAQSALDEANEKAKAADETAQNILDNLPSEVVPGSSDDFGDTGDTDVTIDDPAVPLASGPVTRAEFVDYLWRHEGSPAAAAPTFTDVPADHEFFQAIGWAQANGLVSGDENGAFQPDELVTVADVRAILGRFASVFGTNAVAASALTTLTGDDGEAVLNCDEVLAEFFGEEYVSAKIEDDIAA